MLIVLFSIEIIFKLVLKISLKDWSILRIFIECNIISLVISLLVSKTGRIASKFLNFIICLIVSIYAVIQAGFSNYLGVFMSLGTSSQAGAVKDYIKDYLDSFMWYYWLILIPIVLLLIYYLFIEPRFYKKNKDKYLKEELEYTIVSKKRLVNSNLLALASIIIFVGLFYFTLVSNTMQNKIQLKSNTSLFINPDMPNIAVNQFGIFTYGLLDVKSTLSPVEEQEVYYAASPKTEEKEETPEETDYKRNIDDTAWLKVIEQETNNNYKSLNNYYINKTITNKNDYTGIFENKN